MSTPKTKKTTGWDYLHLCDYIRVHNASEKQLLLFLCKAGDGKGRSFHSIASIAWRTQLNRATVHAAKTALKELGVLDWERRTNQYNHLPNAYTLNLERMRELAEKGKEELKAELEKLRNATSQKDEKSSKATSQNNEKSPEATSHENDKSSAASDKSPAEVDMSPPSVEMAENPASKDSTTLNTHIHITPNIGTPTEATSAETRGDKQEPFSAATTTATQSETMTATAAAPPPASGAAPLPDRRVCGPTDSLSIAGSPFRTGADWATLLRQRDALTASDASLYSLRRNGKEVTGSALVYWEGDFWEVRDSVLGERLVR